MPELFNSSLADAQATSVRPVAPSAFDFDRYEAYCDGLKDGCETFWKGSEGVMVYRRMRVAECFSYGCQDRTHSLALQLGALQKSMLFEADVPNFLEPWYGIGTLASAYGGEYQWPRGNAPILLPRFSSLDELLAFEPLEIAETPIGKHTLEMIDYFLEQTRGRVPLSLTDTQSPLNMVGHLYPLDQFFMDCLLEPEKVRLLFDRLAELLLRFNDVQRRKIGSALVSPGHGFASSTQWTGLGMSDDNVLMLSPEQYSELVVPVVEQLGAQMGGPAFHSCGDWTNWIDAVRAIKGLRMVDAALSPQTDPGATDRLEAFHAFAHSGIVLNARMVGGLEVIQQQLARLWTPGLKLVVVTYCETPTEQAAAYRFIHASCQS